MSYSYAGDEINASSRLNCLKSFKDFISVISQGDSNLRAEVKYESLKKEKKEIWLLTNYVHPMHLLSKCK